ncbi:MAG: methyltransferase family protein [Mobilitalea sp.]|jgi:protein-S-isoprenylcysteine O-methyltransferase Ste14
MIQIIGVIEVLIFYVAYLLKLINQRKKGIKTNQLGIGNKSRKTVIIESLLRFSSTAIVIVVLVSAILNTSLFSNQMVRGIGLALLGLGTCLFIIAMVTMQDNWRAGIPEKDKTDMVTTGIYTISRNPAFLGFDLTYIGASLAFGNIIVLILTALTIALMHLQILEEEKYLETTFGNRYDTYKNKVGRYLVFF